jgi:hypothetical protein
MTTIKEIAQDPRKAMRELEIKLGASPGDLLREMEQLSPLGDEWGKDLVSESGPPSASQCNLTVDVPAATSPRSANLRGRSLQRDPSMAHSFWHQLRANAVALISLTVALTALGYNTWRNEQTEENRNIRMAAFEVLTHLGELQLVVNASFFLKDGNLGHPSAGWGRVALITDLSQVLPAPAPQRAEELHRVWQANWQGIADNEDSVERITAEIDRSRETIREILRKLR